jgi:hypothetical protein
MSQLKIRSIRQAEKETASLLHKIQAAGINGASCEAYGADIGVQVWPPFPDHDSGRDLVAVLLQDCWEITLRDPEFPYADGDNTVEVVEAVTTADAVAFILDWSQRGGHW